MDNGIQMETNMEGGFMKGLGRMFSGDSLFIATYTASRPNQEIVLASSFPGNIAAIDVSRIPVKPALAIPAVALIAVALGLRIAAALKERVRAQAA